MTITRCICVLLLASSLAAGPGWLAPPAWAQDEKSQSGEAGRELRVKTTREPRLIAPLLRLFENLTRTRLEITYLEGDVMARLQADVAASRADLFIASDIGQLLEAKARGLTAPVGRPAFLPRIPEQYREPEGHWVGLSRRMRVLVVAPGVERAGELTYEALAEPAWAGKLCVRSGSHPYNLLLVASLIAHKGPAFAERWLRGIKSNLARKPSGGDRDQIAGVSSGTCEVALVNSYYAGGIGPGGTVAPSGRRLTVVFPNAAGRGAHASISGMALLKGAANKDNALLLMDFLTSKPAQFYYSSDNHEHPIRADVELSKVVAAWGRPKQDDLPVHSLAARLDEAAELVRKVSFDDGPGGQARH